ITVTLLAGDNYKLSNTPGISVTVRDNDGLREEDVQALNDAALPQVTAAIARQISGSVQTRVETALNCGRQERRSLQDSSSHCKRQEGLSLQDSSLRQYFNQYLEGQFNRAREQEQGGLSLFNDRPQLLLSDMAFALSLDDRDKEGAADTWMDNITVWGQGYHSGLKGNEGVQLDGSVTGGIIGIDYLRPGLLLGLGLNNSWATMDWNNSQLTGQHKTRLTGFHPYFGWQLGDEMRFWGNLGVDRGDIEITTDGRPADDIKTDVELRTAGLGGYGLLFELAGEGTTRLGFIGDGTYTYLLDRDETVFSSVDSGWVRLGLEMDYDRPLQSGGQVGGRLDATWRRDFSDLLSGSGMEVGGGLDFFLPGLGLRLDINVRTLLVHSKDIEEWGISGGFAWALRSDGRGLSLAFKPQWGEVGSDKQQLWDSGLEDVSGGAINSAMRYQLELKYGIPVMRGQELLSIFARSELQNDDRNLDLGADFKLGEHFSTGYETDIETDHSGYIRYQRGF
ncbi:MAG: hypothetical protein ACR2P9_03725, partial [Gammaproteobacteria bacterium]